MKNLAVCQKFYETPARELGRCGLEFHIELVEAFLEQRFLLDEDLRVTGST